MKRLLLGLMLLVTATAASAEWTSVDETDKFYRYVDSATIRRNGNFVKMWNLDDFKAIQKMEGLSYLSDRTLSEYDCNGVRRRFIAYAWFDGRMANGNVVISNNDTADWNDVAPGTTGETLWKIACGKK